MSTRKPKQYTEEFRKSSAKLAFESDQPISVTAKELGLQHSTLYTWVIKHYPNHLKCKESSSDPDPLEEVKRLRKELKRVTMERDILKKATAYFAGETL